MHFSFKNPEAKLLVLTMDTPTGYPEERVFGYCEERYSQTETMDTENPEEQPEMETLYESGEGKIAQSEYPHEERYPEEETYLKEGTIQFIPSEEGIIPPSEYPEEGIPFRYHESPLEQQGTMEALYPEEQPGTMYQEEQPGTMYQEEQPGTMYQEEQPGTIYQQQPTPSAYPEEQQPEQIDTPSGLGLTDILRCPICLDLPKNKVFQCREGHSLCEECYVQLSACPQCRLPFETVPIRSLPVEMVLDKLILDLECPHKDSGCTIKSHNRKIIRDHGRCCSFSPMLNVCEALGFGNCSFRMNGGTTVEEAIRHFETVHGAAVRNSTTLKVTFSDFLRFPGATKLIILNQKENGYAILLQVTIVQRGPTRINWIPFYLRYPMLGRLSEFDANEATRQFDIHYSCSSQSNPNSRFTASCEYPPWDILKYADPSSVTTVCPTHMLDMDTMQFQEGSPKSLSVFLKLIKIGVLETERAGTTHPLVINPHEMWQLGNIEQPESDLERRLLTYQTHNNDGVLRSPIDAFGTSANVVHHITFWMPTPGFGRIVHSRPLQHGTSNLTSIRTRTDVEYDFGAPGSHLADEAGFEGSPNTENNADPTLTFSEYQFPLRTRNLLASGSPVPLFFPDNSPEIAQLYAPQPPVYQSAFFSGDGSIIHRYSYPSARVNQDNETNSENTGSESELQFDDSLPTIEERYE